MKMYKAEINMQVVTSGSIDATIYRIVAKDAENPSMVRIVEEGTNNSPRWIDVSVLEQATIAQLLNAGVE